MERNMAGSSRVPCCYYYLNSFQLCSDSAKGQFNQTLRFTYFAEDYPYIMRSRNEDVRNNQGLLLCKAFTPTITCNPNSFPISTKMLDFQLCSFGTDLVHSAVVYVLHMIATALLLGGDSGMQSLASLAPPDP